MATVSLTITTTQGTVSRTENPTDVRMQQFMDDLIAHHPMFENMTRAQAAQLVCDQSIDFIINWAKTIRRQAIEEEQATPTDLLGG